MPASRRQTQELESIMETLLYNKRLEIPYRKLLRLMDREHWTTGAMQDVRDAFEAVGGDASVLQHCFFFNEILFLNTVEMKDV